MTTRDVETPPMAEEQLILVDERNRATGFAGKIAGDVVRHVKTRIGVTCGVSVKAPGEVPRSQGKAVRVKDLRKKA